MLLQLRRILISSSVALLLALSMMALFPSAEGAAPPGPPGIMQAAVSGGRCWTLDRASGYIDIRIRPLAGTEPEVVWTSARVEKTKDTLPGQGTLNPRPTFSDHAVVELTVKGADGKNKTILFDPSYGAIYDGGTDNDRLLAFQQKAVAYIGVQKELVKNTKYQITFTPVVATTPLMFGFDRFK